MRQAHQINSNAEGDDVRRPCGKELQLEGGYKAKVEADQATNLPQVFTRAHPSHQGEDLSARAVEDAIQLSEEKCCSVGAWSS